jgi:hypothetical protein
VKQVALAESLTVLQPDHPSDETFLETLRSMRSELAHASVWETLTTHLDRSLVT